MDRDDLIRIQRLPSCVKLQIDRSAFCPRGKIFRCFIIACGGVVDKVVIFDLSVSCHEIGAQVDIRSAKDLWNRHRKMPIIADFVIGKMLGLFFEILPIGVEIHHDKDERAFFRKLKRLGQIDDLQVVYLDVVQNFARDESVRHVIDFRDFIEIMKIGDTDRGKVFPDHRALHVGGRLGRSVFARDRARCFGNDGDPGHLIVNDRDKYRRQDCA